MNRDGPFDLSRLLTLREVAKMLPPSRSNRPVHVATLHRWRMSGIRGIRLECTRAPGGWLTTAEAVETFFRRLAGEGLETPSGVAKLQQRPRTGNPADVETALGKLGL